VSHHVGQADAVRSEGDTAWKEIPCLAFFYWPDALPEVFQCLRAPRRQSPAQRRPGYLIAQQGLAGGLREQFQHPGVPPVRRREKPLPFRISPKRRCQVGPGASVPNLKPAVGETKVALIDGDRHPAAVIRRRPQTRPGARRTYSPAVFVTCRTGPDNELG